MTATATATATATPLAFAIRLVGQQSVLRSYMRMLTIILTVSQKRLTLHRRAFDTLLEPAV